MCVSKQTNQRAVVFVGRWLVGGGGDLHPSSLSSSPPCPSPSPGLTPPFESCGAGAETHRWAAVSLSLAPLALSLSAFLLPIQFISNPSAVSFTGFGWCHTHTYTHTQTQTQQTNSSQSQTSKKKKKKKRNTVLLCFFPAGTWGCGRPPITCNNRTKQQLSCLGHRAQQQYDARWFTWDDGKMVARGKNKQQRWQRKTEH